VGAGRKWERVINNIGTNMQGLFIQRWTVKKVGLGEQCDIGGVRKSRTSLLTPGNVQTQGEIFRSQNTGERKRYEVQSEGKRI